MEADKIYEVITKLVGEIRPSGCSQRDKESNENLVKFIEVFNKMHTDIDDIAYLYEYSHENSVRKASEIASKQLKLMGID